MHAKPIKQTGFQEEKNYVRRMVQDSQEFLVLLRTCSLLYVESTKIAFWNNTAERLTLGHTHGKEAKAAVFFSERKGGQAFWMSGSNLTLYEDGVSSCLGHNC